MRRRGVDGWSVADENGTSNLLKSINPAWTNDELGITPWTTADYHRSFWATSVAFGANNKKVNKPYSAIANPLTNAFGAAVYTQENTPAAVVNDPLNNDLTKVIVAAHLQYKEETPAQICKYKGLEYYSENDVKTEIANDFANIYYKKVGENKYESLAPADYSFVKANTGGKDYQVSPQVKSALKKATVDGKVTYVDATAEANTALAKVYAEVRTANGSTYYFTTIWHLAAEGKLAHFSVVRNHSYKVNIEAIKGFGTPVYNPDEEIVPTYPDDKATYLAARIYVLSWRVVPSNVTLGK